MNISRHLINFLMISLQKIDQGKATLSQLHHDLGVIVRYISTEQAGEDPAMILHGFRPMIPCKEFDLLREALTCRIQGNNKGKDLDFFTGKPVPSNPLLPNNLFATPESFEGLQEYCLRHNGSERRAALTCSNMAINLCHRAVQEMLSS